MEDYKSEMKEKEIRIDIVRKGHNPYHHSFCYPKSTKFIFKILENRPLRGQRPSSGTPEKSPCPHPYISPLESCPSYILGTRSTRTPSHHKEPGAPGRHHTTRSTRTPSHHKDPGAPGRHPTTRTQEHSDAITPQVPRSTQTPLQHKPHAGTQEHRTPLD
ncbi:hypothetical protein STEG23_010610 [Scotinomys teguina]